MPSQNPIAIIQMGLPPEGIRSSLGDQADWFAAALGLPRANLLVVEAFEGGALPLPKQFSCAILTGSWAMVTDCEPWSEHAAAWLKGLIDAGKPVLGVCYGHQLMAHALGGRVGDLPSGPERGLFVQYLTTAGQADPWLQGLPNPFAAYLSHRQAVLEPPAGVQVLGGSRNDAFQILRYGPSALSMQAHPEFTATIMSACAAGHENGDSRLDTRTREQIRQSPWLPQPLKLLRRFVDAHAPVNASAADA